MTKEEFITEQTRIDKLYRSLGLPLAKNYIQDLCNGYLELDGSMEYAISSARTTMALAFSVPSEFTLEDWAAMLKQPRQDVYENYSHIKEVLELGARYRGKVDGITLINLVDEGVEKGFSRKAALLGVKLGLAHEYGAHEYFSMEDVGEIFGISTNEAQSFMTEEAKKGNIELITISSSPFLQ